MNRMIVLLWPRQECSQKWFKDLYHVCKQRKIINICTDYNFLIRNVLVFNRRWILNSGIFLIIKCQNSYMSELVLELQLAFSVINEGQQTWLLNGWFIIVNPMTTFDDTAAGSLNFSKILPRNVYTAFRGHFLVRHRLSQDVTKHVTMSCCFRIVAMSESLLDISVY